MQDLIIEKIIKSRISGRCILILSDGSSIKALIDSVLERKLNKGKSINQADIDFIESEFNKNGIKNYAFKLCEGFSRSEFQIFNKLKIRNFPVDDINSTIEKLKEIGLIDDKKFSDNFIRYAVRKKWGKNKIIRELQIRKVNPGNYEENLITITEGENFFESALELAIKKQRLVQNKDSQKQMDSIRRHLLAKGFDFEIIKKVIMKLFKNKN